MSWPRGRAAAGRHQLDQIGAGFDLLARCLAHLIGTVSFASDEVSVAAGHRNDPTRELHPWSFNEAAIDGIAQRHLDIFLTADITNCRHAVRKRTLADIHSFQHEVIAMLFQQREDTFAAVVADMNMRVDQAGHQPLARNIVLFRVLSLGRQVGGAANPGDLIAFDVHSRIRQWRATVSVYQRRASKYVVPCFTPSVES